SRLDYAKTLNPVYILRNYMCEEAIRDAHQGDYQRVNHLLAMVREPTKYYVPLADYADAPPKWAEGIFLTCSS
ncbi:MAG: SELO family protein, partial [Marinobacterium sp.]